jgi:hypothetical protein
MQSVRGVGYDTPTAIADLIDNSIAAEAATVWLTFNWLGGDSTVTVLDDGRGMNAEQLEQAMKLGSTNPLAERSTNDLGRFGLGLKTASLSQCRRVIVASKVTGGEINVRVWDLAVVEETNDWLVEDDARDSERPLLEPLARLASGTAVIWCDLDRVVNLAPDEDKSRLFFQRTAQAVEGHVAMTFHRYLEGPRPSLRIHINGDSDEFRIRPWDPFCSWHEATQQLPEARRGTKYGVVVMQGVVLPHKDRFDTDEYDRAGGPAGWVSQQGFYVYRNRRLLLPGSWLGLGEPKRWTKDEQHKLARIRIDLPNTADSAWCTDITKSKTQPPLELRDWLSRLASPVRTEAKEVFVHRGSRQPATTRAAFSPVWLEMTTAGPQYRINREHPLVADLIEASGASKTRVSRLLSLIESTVPVHRIWLDVADRPETPPPTREQLPSEDVLRIAKDLLERMINGQKLGRVAALHRLLHTEPFDQYPEIIAALEE